MEMKKHFIGNRKSGIFLAKKLAELCLYSSVLWKMKRRSNKIGYIAEESTKQSVKGVTWFLLTAYSKIG